MKKMHDTDRLDLLWQVAEVKVKYQGKRNLNELPVNTGSQSAEEIRRANWAIIWN